VQTRKYDLKQISFMIFLMSVGALGSSADLSQEMGLTA
jgi:hypothetical protein